MKLIKKNLKLIVGILMGMILVSGVSVYATYKYYATEVSYTKNGKEMSVEEALNELYEIKKDYIKPNGTKTITKNGDYDVTNISKVIVNVPIPNNYMEKPTKTLEITKNGTTNVTDYAAVNVNVAIKLPYEQKTVQYPSSGSTIKIDLGFVPSAFTMYAVSKESGPYYWYSDGSLQTIRQGKLESGAETVTTKVYLEGTSIVFAPANPSNWYGRTFSIFAVE